MALLSAGRFLPGFVGDEGELDFALDVVNAVSEDADTVSDGEDTAGVLADDLAGVLAVGEVVVFQGVNRHQALYEQLGKFDEEAVLHDVDDEAIKVFSQAGF